MRTLWLALLLAAAPLAAQPAPEAGTAYPAASETIAPYTVTSLVLGGLGLLAGLGGVIFAMRAGRAAGDARREVEQLKAEKRREMALPARVNALEAKVKALEQRPPEAPVPAATGRSLPAAASGQPKTPPVPPAPATPRAPPPAEPRVSDDLLIDQATAAFNALVAQPTPEAVTRFENEQGADSDGLLWRLHMAGIGELVFPGPEVVRNWGRQFRGLPGASARERALGEWYEVESGDALHVERVARRGADGTIEKGLLRGA